MLLYYYRNSDTRWSLFREFEIRLDVSRSRKQITSPSNFRIWLIELGHYCHLSVMPSLRGSSQWAFRYIQCYGSVCDSYWHKTDHIFACLSFSASFAHCRAISCCNPSFTSRSCSLRTANENGSPVRRHELINHAVFKPGEESRRNKNEPSLCGRRKKERGERVRLSCFRRWSHGDSQHVYSAMIITDYYTLLSRRPFFSQQSLCLVLAC